MRFLMDYAFPVLVVGLGYIGINKVSAKADWPFFLKALLHTTAMVLLFGMLLYEYMAERPIIDSVRDMAGAAFCKQLLLEHCPDQLKIEAADEEAHRISVESIRLKKQNRLVEAEAWTQKAVEASKRAWELRQQANDKRRLALAIAVVKDALGAGSKTRLGAVLDDFALVGWTQEPMGGEALLKFDATARQWRLIKLGGGAWSIDELARASGMSREKAKALLDKVPIGMDRS